MKNGSIVVGVTGGAASGKSVVMHMLALKGAVCFSADQAARVLVGPGSAVLNAFREYIGEDILSEDGSLNRARLAEMIFDSAEIREIVNRILHPPILRLLRAQMDGALDDLPHRSIVAVEVPLLFETGIQSWFDSTLLVSTSEENQITRLRNRNGLNEVESRKRIAAQWPDNKKVSLADYVVKNDCTREDLQSKIDKLWLSF